MCEYKKSQYLLQIMQIKYRTKIRIQGIKIFIIIGAISILAQAQKNFICSQTCEICSTNSSACNACADGHELSHIGQCVSSSTVQNCQFFGLRDTCLACKPTFRLLLNNTCVKMTDGCLISGPAGVCSKCLDGAIKNQFGQCQNKYLNCLKLSQNRQCILCQRGYRIQGGKCKNNDQNCQFSESTNGLCVLCKKGYKLLQYRCVRPEQAQNCYIVSEDFQTCSYCKSGYESYYGKCYTAQKIDVLIYQGNVTKKCTSSQYFDLRSQLCYPQPQYCERFDYGFMRCVSCLSTYVIIGGLCRDPSLRYCQKFDPLNPYACKLCLPKFFLTSNNFCRQFSPFCQQVSNQKCVKCIDLFLLNSKGTCQDPNCQIYDNSLSQCVKCKASYFKDASTNICTFQDINCIETGSNDTCKKCKIDYVYDINKKICKFVDPYCKIFSQKQVCLECRAGYYMNEKNNVCMQLPYKCLNADSQGKCKYCAQGFALLTSRECSLIVNISNCLASSNLNSGVCKICKEGFYVDETGTCIDLPPLCEEFDSVKRLCLKCNQNSENRKGFCFDNFCQVFGAGAQCLGCKPGYQFGKKGQCISEQADPNCKQFMNGQCRVCSDRYYFNSVWKCTNVSTLCRNYDPNNGDCTSCYSGYALEDGICIRESDRVVCQIFTDSTKQICKKCKRNYKLDEKDGQCYLYDHGCIKRNVSNRVCLKCTDNYVLDEGSGNCLKLPGAISNNTPPSPSSEDLGYIDRNCIQYNANRTACNKCVSRMYYSKQNGSKCVAVDPNCRSYVEMSGECTECYEGYSVSANRMGCQLSKPKDINCKTFSGDGNGCIQCYSGFYYSVQQKLCVLVDSLCKTSDASNGRCLSCWGGYSLVYGRCIINNQPAQPTTMLLINATNSSINPSSSPTSRNATSATLPIRCQSYDRNAKRCVKCVNGAAYDEQTRNCEYPLLGLDVNCIEYRSRLCTKCMEKYRLINKKCML